MTQPDHPRPKHAGESSDRPPHLAHHFDSLEQQADSARLGMWLFLVTEILFFGGLFCAYAVYRANRPEVFVDGSHFLDTSLGAANTVLLIFSSLTMALAVRSAQMGRRVALAGLLAVTLLCAIGFLGVKTVEYQQKWNHRLVPGQARIEYFFGLTTSEGSLTERALDAPRKEFLPDRHYLEQRLGHDGLEGISEDELSARVDNLRSFMAIYFGLTALHALHVILGIGVMFWLLFGAVRGRFGPENSTPVDLVGLYWHLVDMIWIYLFPLLYLIH